MVRACRFAGCGVRGARNRLDGTKGAQPRVEHFDVTSVFVLVIVFEAQKFARASRNGGHSVAASLSASWFSTLHTSSITQTSSSDLAIKQTICGWLLSIAAAISFCKNSLRTAETQKVHCASRFALRMAPAAA
jgi:hypothetical protein